MKKILLTVSAALVAAGCFALPKAIYVKKGDNFLKYNFGVAQDLKFSDNGTKLKITGYSETIDLSQIDYITFNAPVDTKLTPDALKSHLLDAGQEFAAKIKANDHKDVIEMAQNFAPYADYTVPDSLLDIHGVFTGRYNMVANVAKAASGDIASLRKTRAQATDIYRVSEFYGIYQPDATKKAWVKTGTADHFEIRFPGNGNGRYSVTLTGSGKDWSVEQEGEEGGIKAIIPEHIVVTLNHDNAVLATVTADTNVDLEALTADAAATLSVNGYDLSVKMNVTNSRVTEESSMTIGGKTVLTSNAVMNGVALLDYEKWEEENAKMEWDEYYDEEEGWVEIEPEAGIEAISYHFLNGRCSADILGKVQVNGRVSSLPRIIEEMGREYEDDEYYDDEMWFPGVWNVDHTVRDCYEGVKEEVRQKQADLMNSYSDITISYNNDGKPQAFMTVEPYDNVYGYDDDGYWDDEGQNWIEQDCRENYHYWDLMPVIEFPDGTNYAGEDFFAEGFGALVTDYESIIRAYENLIGK